MNKFLLLASLLVASCQCTDCATDTQTESVGYESKYGSDPMTNPEFMEAWTASMIPGEAHEQLAKGVGDWNASGNMWMTEGSDAIPFTATSHTESILGGRYIVQDYKSDFMGQPFEGMMLMGYDNVSNEYFSIWVDSMSTGHSRTTGNRDADDVLRMKGVLSDVLTPDGRPWGLSMQNVTDDEIEFSMYDTNSDGVEWKVMEITYTRANK